MSWHSYIILKDVTAIKVILSTEVLRHRLHIPFEVFLLLLKHKYIYIYILICMEMCVGT